MNLPTSVVLQNERRLTDSLPNIKNTLNTKVMKRTTRVIIPPYRQQYCMLTKKRTKEKAAYHLIPRCGPVRSLYPLEGCCSQTKGPHRKVVLLQGCLCPFAGYSAESLTRFLLCSSAALNSKYRKLACFGH